MTKKQVKMLALATYRLTKLCAFAAFVTLLALTIQQDREPTELEKIQAAGKITMVSRNGSTTYYEGASGLTGFEYLLASAFAKHLNVELEIKDEPDLGTMIATIDQASGQFAAAGLTVTEARQNTVDFGPAYAEVKQTLIYRKGTKRPKTIEDLAGGVLVVIADSSHEENLNKLKFSHPSLRWQVRHGVEMMDLMELVHDGSVDYAVVDSNAYEINTALYPRARRAFDVSEAQALAWAFAKQQDPSLMREVEAFFAKPSTHNLIAKLRENFYGHIDKIDFAGSLVFTKRLETRLPRWKAQLQEAAEKHELDWQLLAALSYQESHWNPRAVSRTGVRGFMMLTQGTAKQVGVKNRSDAKQSIDGGTRYFKSLYNRLPKRIQDPDRTWLALAAYNIGMGHLEDARILTQRHGHNPDKWSDVRKHLPLLAKSKYYKKTKHGYARGWEAVDYVQNIRNFYNIIAWNEKSNKDNQLASLDTPSEYASVSSTVTEAVRNLSEPSFEL
ncbi:membrane-bound lytic murein transglycosylase MltF [Agaribacterium sp. ZY112]|uniref:membrane-bound lytic murein transglycosylase MltF n=1 Tax=Agaribacterium sp. ZY112 TaxID=3233574 RepID=UPI003523CD5E